MKFLKAVQVIFAAEKQRKTQIPEFVIRGDGREEGKILEIAVHGCMEKRIRGNLHSFYSLKTVRLKKNQKNQCLWKINRHFQPF